MRFNLLKATAGVILLFLFTILPGQSTFPDLVENAYGLDQELINGIQYYNRYLLCEGHPYFPEDRFAKGSLTINGKVYQNMRLKYDLLSQDVEIEYETFSGGNNRIFIVSERISAFSMDAYEFRRLKIPGDRESFCQVINTRNFTCYVHWEKKLVRLYNSVTHIYRFTYPECTCWLELGNEIKAFDNRKSFVRLFPVSIQQEIRKLLRRRGVSFRYVSPDEIIRTMHAVDNLVNSKGQL
jgi:hypothetical protein